jgi:hypothetical protein
MQSTFWHNAIYIPAGCYKEARGFEVENMLENEDQNSVAAN